MRMVQLMSGVGLCQLGGGGREGVRFKAFLNNPDSLSCLTLHGG